jgi:hypothetical protein
MTSGRGNGRDQFRPGKKLSPCRNVEEARRVQSNPDAFRPEVVYQAGMMLQQDAIPIAPNAAATNLDIPRPYMAAVVNVGAELEWASAEKAVVDGISSSRPRDPSWTQTRYMGLARLDTRWTADPRFCR